MTLPPRITMVTLGVADVAAATAFYERLGFVKSSASNDSVTFFRLDGTVLESSQRCDGTPDCAESEDEAFCDEGTRNRIIQTIEGRA